MFNGRIVSVKRAGFLTKYPALSNRNPFLLWDRR
jgi:hypothetical protein